MKQWLWLACFGVLLLGVSACEQGQPSLPVHGVEDATFIRSPLPVLLTDTPQPQEAISTAEVAIVTRSPRCDWGAAGQPIDVTVPDGTVFQPGEMFIKTWRIVNVGNCIWDEGYALVWFSGDRLDGEEVVPFSGRVAPGEQVDLSLGLRAPERGGVYQGYWKLRNPQGELFGIGPEGQSPFWVRIEVVAQVTETPLPVVVPTETPVPFVRGAAVLLSGQGLDLDSGSLTGEEMADFEFRVREDGISVWQPLHGGSLGVYGGVEPSLAACRETSLSGDAVALDALGPGAYVCFRSNMGLPGYLRLVDYVENSGQVSFEFLVWLVP
ncbi:MAG: hypothetical protein KA988_02950 [Longilinea sp.]|nr:hypothetical protein [Longilinea sp.]